MPRVHKMNKYYHFNLTVGDASLLYLKTTAFCSSYPEEISVGTSY